MCRPLLGKRITISRLMDMLLLLLVTAHPACAQDAYTPAGLKVLIPPEAHLNVALTAISEEQSGKGVLLFAGKSIPPTIHVAPGSVLHVTYKNAMDRIPREPCVAGPCTNMTNLHFHGLHVSPDKPQDDVLTMMANPGETLRYTVAIPQDQPSGLYWYHTHPHGESYQQDLDGMSGAIVVDGIERYYPELRTMKERVLLLRDMVVPADGARADRLRQAVQAKQTCNSSSSPIERLFTVNGEVRPLIDIAPGERQFWRVVNTSPDLYADLSLDGERMMLVALDGMPLSYHDPGKRPLPMDNIQLPPGGRAEFIVTGQKLGQPASLRTSCVDTGPDGDPNPSMVLADLATGARDDVAYRHALVSAPVFKPLADDVVRAVQQRTPDFQVRFTEDQHGFYINDHKFEMGDPPLVTVRVGAYYHWRIVNDTNEVHPFHIHQVHFMTYRVNDRSVATHEWRDTVNVPVRGTVDLFMDMTDPIIRGESVFHCHLLKHEDKGMMAKVLFK